MFERDLAVQSGIDFEGKPLNEEEVKKIPSGGCNYVATYNEHLSVGQMQGIHHPQEDRICVGSAPDYFDQAEDIRHVFMRNVCEKLQKRLSISVPEMWQSGSTVLLLFTNGEVIDIGYLGDGEVFLIVEEPGKPSQCHLLNPFHHHATHPEERKRIEAAGGVIKPGSDGLERLQGYLMLSGGIGNNKINGRNDKNKIIRREPTCITEPVTHDGKKNILLIAATDGLTAKAKPEAHDTYIEEKFKVLSGKPPEQQLLDLLKEVKKDGGADDTTAALLKITKGMTPRFIAQFDSHWGPEVAIKAIEEITLILNEELANINSYKEGTPTVSSLSSQEVPATLPLEEDSPVKPAAPTPTPRPAAAGPDPARDEISRKVLVRQNAVVLQLGEKRTKRDESSEEEDSEELNREKFSKGSPQ